MPDDDLMTDPDDLANLVNAALTEVESTVATAAPAAPSQTQETDNLHSGIDLLGDVDLHVKIELGRTHMLVEDVLRLTDGSIVELDKLAGDPVDVYVNDRLIARGEVLVLNDNFCIRISEIVANLDEQAEAAARQQIEEAG